MPVGKPRDAFNLSRLQSKAGGWGAFFGAFLLLLASAQCATAAPASSSTPAKKVSQPKAWTVKSTVARTNSLYDLENGRDVSSWDFSLRPRWKLNRLFALSGLLEASQDINEERFQFSTLALSLAGWPRVMDRDSVFQFLPRVGVSVPLLAQSRAASHYLTGSLGCSASVNKDYLFSKRFDLTFDFSASRMAHEYETAQSGSVNTQFSLAQSVHVSWSFSDSLNLSASAGHYDAFSYQSAHRDYLYHSQELGWQYSPQVGFAIGHSWGMPYVSTRKANGQDFNFELMDEVNSLVYANATLSL